MAVDIYMAMEKNNNIIIHAEYVSRGGMIKQLQ